MSQLIERFAERKAAGEPIVVATAYDAPTARLVEGAGLDAILVGDSVGMVVLGYPDTLSVTVDDMTHHTMAVQRGATRTLVITDMPAGTYQTADDALVNAARLVEAGAHAVKLEGGTEVAPVVRALVTAGIAVHGHVGLTPQHVQSPDGFRVQGRTAESARGILDDALALQEAGCFAIVIECVPARLAAHITAALDIPTIGIGAGPETSGQVLVLHDLLGLTEGSLPRFVKRYADLSRAAHTALATFREEVRGRAFPALEHRYEMPELEWQRFLEAAQLRFRSPSLHSQHTEGNDMNRDELKGKREQLKGRAKQAFGDLTDDERLRNEGVNDEMSGEVQEGFGRARRKIGEKVEEIGERLKD